ncbi:MAG: rhodanese-like domain-containing protein [Proteobacteria bacterium]|nr:rhodanese-like domain-containing protein [Pseudomonadota bacterium]MBU1610453.1 rhodanese-like domain-containing protein [Pseudomonadota bacterium]
MSLIIAIIVLSVIWEAMWIVLGLKHMSPWQLRRRLEAGERLRIVDVRTRTEYDLFHIPEAKSAPLFTGASFDAAMDLHGDPGGPPTVVVVCMTGHRSPLVAWQLMKTGISNSYNLTGGMLLWKLTGGKSVRTPKP